MTRSTSFNQEIEYLLKVMDFFLLLKIWLKRLVKVYTKTEVVNAVRNFLIMLNKKQQNKLVI